MTGPAGLPPPPPDLLNAAEAQAIVDSLPDESARAFVNTLYALAIRRAYGPGRYAADAGIDAAFWVRVFAEFSADRDAIRRILALGDPVREGPGG
ncbi:MAG: hypothetical protein U0800_07900 [Isosphaeraceae bacterium]